MIKDNFQEGEGALKIEYLKIQQLLFKNHASLSYYEKKTHTMTRF